MKRLLLSCLVTMASSAALATQLYDGSIDFDDMSLWGKEVSFGLDDSGKRSGATRWYADGENTATINRKSGNSSSGILTTSGKGLHRTIPALSSNDGPAAGTGQSMPTSGLYIDAVVTVNAYDELPVKPRTTGDDRDKITFWAYVPKDGSVTNFIITAGYVNEAGELTATNYVTDAAVTPGESFRLVVRALPDAVAVGDAAVTGFEVYVNTTNSLVKSGEVALFPSMVAPASGYASGIYSLGLEGPAVADQINFTWVNPFENPEYAEADYSILTESADIEIVGYPEGVASLSGFPMLVRVSEANIPGFHYSRCASGGGDLRFTDSSGNALPSEVDTWNTAGESLVWVKVPLFKYGAKITMHWGLKTGASNVKNDSTAVWSDYIAVWHMNSSTGYVKDSTGHGFTATMSGSTLEVATGKFGGAGYIPLSTATNHDSLVSSGYLDWTQNGAFTFSGWYLARDYVSGTSEPFVGTKWNGENTTRTDSDGWAGVVWDPNKVSLHYAGGDANRYTADSLPDVRSEWFQLVLAHSATDTANLYCNGQRFADADVTFVAGETNRTFQLLMNGFAGDEIRLSAKVLAAGWVAAEYETVTDSDYFKYYSAVVKGTLNYWVREPSVTPTACPVEDISTLVFDRGEPRQGALVELKFYDKTGKLLDGQPTEAGTYKAVFTVPGTQRYDGLEMSRVFCIIERRAYRQLSGYDRVMLFNSDETPGSEVTLQGYWDVDTASEAPTAENLVWYHADDAWTGDKDCRFVADGSSHIYYAPNTAQRQKLWEFRHARLGNLFHAADALPTGMNYLPWSALGDRFDDSEKRAVDKRHAGTLILQNTSTKENYLDPAGAYSPYYADGVGTVYFDAVNAYGKYVNRLRLEMCLTTNDEVTAGEWLPVKADVFAIADGVYNESMSTSGVEEIVLNMNKDEGTTNWFYRIRAAVNSTTPMRLRIVRSDDPLKGWGENVGLDGEGLVLVDNLIVSYPAMGVELSQYGEDDPGDLVFRGQRAPFDVAFPSTNDFGHLHAQMKVKYIVNNDSPVDTSFVGAMTFKYRWRYLDQYLGDWQEILMDADGEEATRFVSAEALSGLGVGDLEYRCTAVVNAPFYEYCDYSGLVDWAWPDGYTERREDVEVNAEKDGVYDAGHPSPALGTDYFIRIREGASDYEGIRLKVRRADEDASKVQTIAMTLASDHTWRGYYQTLTNVPAGLFYQIETCNRQETTGVDYQFNTNYYHGADMTRLPVNDIAEPGTSADWAQIPCDGLTGYLMFQLDDQNRSLAIIRADYQNFNSWTDANLVDGDVNGHFVGTSQDFARTSGVSRTTRRYSDDFSAATATVATNRFWRESFDEPATNSGTWAIEVPFTGTKRTPNGWTAANGMWVAEEYRKISGSTSIAFQMEGEGHGSLLFSPTLTVPRGLGEFSYTARIAQTHDIHAINHYTGTNNVYAMANYTFAVRTGMRDQDDDDFTGLGSVSAFAYFRETVGGYEARAERTDTDKVQLSLYKWYKDGSTKLLAKSGEYSRYGGSGGRGFDGYGDKFNALVISCTNVSSGVRIIVGMLQSAAEVRNTFLSGRYFDVLKYEDQASDRYTHGTVGVTSRDCPAVFALPELYDGAIPWSTSSALQFPGLGHSLITSTDDYECWNCYDRLWWKDFYLDTPYKTYGFKAQPPSQYIVVEASPHGNANDFSPIATNVVKSFGLIEYPNAIYTAEDVNVRLTVGREDSDVVVDDAEATQWRGLDYDDEENPDYGQFWNIIYGAPTNFVYTRGWFNEAHELELSAMRTTADAPCSLRSPLMDGGLYRGLGLGQFSFAYRDADARARLIVQIATNNVYVTDLANLTASIDGWEDVATYDFSTMSEDERASGIISCYIGQHGVTGVMRVIVDPTLVAEAHDPAINVANDPAYGRVYITLVGAKDNPKLDTGSWWGWNLRTTDDPMKWLLQDGTRNDPRTAGLAFALNNSVSDDVRADEQYVQHMPFLQTPVFTSGVIGEVTFKARRYSAGDAAPTVAIYGTTSLDPAADDADFEYIGEVVINSDRYETYSYQSQASKNYSAIRLAVTGVNGVTGERGPSPKSGNVERVLIDEVAVFEAIRARYGFRKVGAFRSNLDGLGVVANVPSRTEQPLCNESWGVQCELYAAQLSEKLDTKREPVVLLHWFKGEEPWGYENWRNLPAAETAPLARAEGTDALVYRSSYFAGGAEAIVPPSTAAETVQYSLEVVYYMEGSDEALTNTLAAADWEKPEWYNPIDFNENQEAFAAYNILDTVSPGWAWLNEVNLFGDYYGDWKNTDSSNQYVEVAAPSEADLTGWQLKMYVADTADNSVLTNTVATFGEGTLSGTKQDLLGQASGMVFRVIASRPTLLARKLKRADGTLDGIWSIPDPDGYVFKTSGGIATGEIGEDESFGIQLVRPSGIVEHEIVVIGTNYWARYGEDYNPTNTVNFFNKYMKNANFVYVGDDNGGVAKSLSVWDSRGATSNDWDRTMILTPGRINTWADGKPQNLDPDHPTPHGSSIFIYSNLEGGHIFQTVGDAVCSSNNQIIVLQTGSKVGTNITYTVSKWFELGSVKTNEAALTLPAEVTTRTYVVNVGQGVSNSFTVVASAILDKALRDAKVDENNRYTPAIIDWLDRGTDAYGNPWPENDGKLCLAKYIPYRRGLTAATNMTVTQMYWLDMCPAISNQFLIAGFATPPDPIIRPVEGYEGDSSLTNVQMTVYMAISNGMHATASQSLESPYVLRGVDPNSTSWDYLYSEESWTNATFKVTGILANGLTRENNEYNWIPLRWFVFAPDSFYQPNDPDPEKAAKAFMTELEVVDPYSSESQGYIAGWGEWIEKHGWRPNVFYSWAIDERMRPVTVEVLRPNNYFEDK